MKIGVKLSLVNAMVIVVIMAVSITFFSDEKHKTT